MEPIEQYFGHLYQQPDPYGYRNRWYEERKRALLLAALTRPRFAAAWELGCSNGELSAALASRCDTLLATDLSARAVELAKERTANFGNVTAMQAAHPGDWPDGRFDLIVFSEVGYFLTPVQLNDCVGRMRESLAPEGILVACHWQHPFAQARTVPAAVHGVIQAGIHRQQLFRYADADFVLEAWSDAASSVAEREGLA